MSKTKEVVLYARAVFSVPKDWTLDFGYDGRDIGFVTPDGETVRPVIGIDVDGAAMVSDTAMAKYGVECLDYLDETGVEDDNLTGSQNVSNSN